MAKQLFVVSHASDDPQRATLPILLAAASKKAGNDVAVYFTIDGVSVLKESVASGIKSADFGALKDHLKVAIDAQIPFYA